MNTDTAPPCADMPGVFFADEPEYNEGLALITCGRCPFRASCLEDTLQREGNVSAEHRWGIAGGMTPTDRASLVRRESRNPDWKSDRLTDLEHTERRILHERGFTDSEIGARVGVNKKVIRAWRHRYRIPTNPELRVDTLTAHQEHQRRTLHAQGMTDIEIGKAVGASRQSISSWRKRRNLPSNTEPAHFSLELHDKLRAAWESGYHDEEIAWAVGMAVTQKAVGEWRRRNGIPINKRRDRKQKEA